MMDYRKYKKQVKLLLSILPIINKDDTFALHGGTGINLFHSNMPRLSVDIDLTYLPVEDKETSLTNISKSLSAIKQTIEHTFSEINVEHKQQQSKLIISNKEATIKVEVNQIKRGCYAEAVQMQLCSMAQQEFDMFCEMKVVEIGHLYGGKICAALDRQHPRDLFDIKNMLQVEGFSEVIKKGFIFYLISSNRTIAEMLKPQYIYQRAVFENQFTGMTQNSFSYEEYEDTRSILVRQIHQSLTTEDKQFLLSIESGEPDWNHYSFEIFPAVQWKLINIQRLKANNPEKHLKTVGKLEAVLSES